MQVQAEGITQEPIKKVNAIWAGELLVDCPYCDMVIDVIKTEEWKDDWAHKFPPLQNLTGVNAEIQCPYCKLLFIVEDVEW